MGWKEQKLSLLCDMFTDGDWVESKDQSLEGVRLIQTGNVGEGVFKDRRDKSRFISEQTFARLKCTEILEGDCLVSRLPDPVGRSCLIPFTSEKMITAVDCTIIRLNRSHLLPEFFNYFTQSYTYLTVVESLTSGATRKRISRKNLGEVPIPLPPIPEQQRIVAILDQAFADIEKARANAEQNLKNARELFDSYLNQVFSQRGAGWVEKTIDEIAELSRGQNPPKSEFIYEPRNGYIRFYQIRDGKSDKHAVYVPESTKLHYVTKSDILMVAYRHVGGVFRGVEGAFNVALCKIKNRDSTKVNDDYLYNIIPSSFVKGELLKASERSLIPSMSVKHLAGLRIPVPPVEQQEEIVSKINRIQLQCKNLENGYISKMTALDELKKSLLQKAFSGELTKTEGQAA